MTTLGTIRVGDIVVHPIYDGTAVLTPDMWAGSDWAAHRHLLDDAHRLVVPVGAFLVRVGDKLLLLDAGVGDIRDDMFEGGQLLKSLAAAGASGSLCLMWMPNSLFAPGRRCSAMPRLPARYFCRATSLGCRRRASSLRTASGAGSWAHHPRPRGGRLTP
jgi:hypothetical protein